MTKRSNRGTGLAEAAGAALILIPIALLMLDLMVVVVANSMNDTACKNAARAAANQTDGGSAWNAANNSLQSFHSSLIVNSITIDVFDYPAAKDAVTCQTTMNVRLPVPMPGCASVIFKAKDIEPIVVK